MDTVLSVRGSLRPLYMVENTDSLFIVREESRYPKAAFVSTLPLTPFLLQKLFSSL